MYQDILNFVGLLDLDADADGVDARLNQNALVLITRNVEGREQDLGRSLGLNLRDIVSLCCLRSEVGERQGCGQAAAHALQVRPQ